MTEAEEVAYALPKYRIKSMADAVQIINKFVGKRDEIGHTMHALIVNHYYTRIMKLREGEGTDKEK